MLVLGSVLRDRYEVVRLLGRDGSGAVYQAYDRSADQPVAVKAIFHHASTDLQFESYARCLKSLRHGALPAVTDCFIETGVQHQVRGYVRGENLRDYLDQQPNQRVPAGRYIVMAYVPGESLAEYLGHQPDGRLGEAAAIELINPVLDALEYLHGQMPPIAHGDVRPDNIRRLPDGRVYLVNFGGAGHHQANRPPDAETEAAPDFCAPEQDKHAAAEPRSDLYALGATLYLLLSGAAPPAAAERMAGDTLAPLRQLAPAVSATLEAVVARLLALQREDRYPSVKALRHDLQKGQAPQACPHCGTPSRSNSKFCRTCGANIHELKLAPPPTPAGNLTPAPATPEAAAQASPPPREAPAPTPTEIIPAPIAPPPAAPPEITTTTVQQAALRPARHRLPVIPLLAAGAGLLVLIVLVLLGRTLFQPSPDIAQPTGGAATDQALPAAQAQQTTTAQTQRQTAAIQARRETAAALTQGQTAAAQAQAQTTTAQAQATIEAQAQTATVQAQASAAAIEPTEAYVGTLPVVLTVRGTNLDRVREALLVAVGGETIALEVQSAGPDQVTLLITMPPALPDGEARYLLQFNGSALQAQSVTLRDFIERKAVQGVLPEYAYTQRVDTDGAGALTSMRAEPDPQSQRVGLLRNNDEIDLLRDDVENWYQVRIRASADQAQVGQVGWIERWLIDNQEVPPQRLAFVGRVFDQAIDGNAQCGAAFESSVWGNVQDASGRAIGGAVVRVTASDGRTSYSATTNRGGQFNVPGLGCTTWNVRLVSVPNTPAGFDANSVQVRNLNGSRYSAVGVQFRQQP